MFLLADGYRKRLIFVNVCRSRQFIHCCESRFDKVIEKAGREEKEITVAKGKKESDLIVSGDGSWSKRGFSLAFGVITLIGYYSNKILDLIVKSSFCKACTA